MSIVPTIPLRLGYSGTYYHVIILSFKHLRDYVDYSVDYRDVHKYINNYRKCSFHGHLEGVISQQRRPWPKNLNRT